MVTLKQFIGNLPTNCLSVFDHFVGLALKGLIDSNISHNEFVLINNVQKEFHDMKEEIKILIINNS